MHVTPKLTLNIQGDGVPLTPETFARVIWPQFERARDARDEGRLDQKGFVAFMDRFQAVADMVIAEFGRFACQEAFVVLKEEKEKRRRSTEKSTDKSTDE